MKKYIALLMAAIVLTLQLNAAQVVTSITGASTNSVLQQPVTITQVVVANPTAATLTLSIFDAPTNSLTWTRGAYTGIQTYSTNYVTTFTNFSGVVQTETNAAVFTAPLVVGAATNNYRLLTTITVAAGTSFTFTPISPYTTSFGLCSTNNTNCTVTTTYNSTF